MNSVFKLLTFILLALLILRQSAMASCEWIDWQQFKQNYISNDGRVMDTTNGKSITTSEGQSYGLFFALVANDSRMFDKLLHWTISNLAANDLTAHLPAWSWGQNLKKQWTVLDHNSPADADLWLAYDLLEAGRLWKNHFYQTLGRQLLERIAHEEVVAIPGLGLMLMPGKKGFIHGNNWRLNPSYMPLQLLARFAALPGPWRAVEKNSERLLVETSPKGFSPNWIIWNSQKGWQSDPEQPDLGSYDAIRVYLWIGMLASDSRQKTDLVKHFLPVATLTQLNGLPPEEINTAKGQAIGKGPIGFSAALLPLLANNPMLFLLRRQVNAAAFPKDHYFNAVLILFSQGWDQQRYRFNRRGKLLPCWNN